MITPPNRQTVTMVIRTMSKPNQASNWMEGGSLPVALLASSQSTGATKGTVITSNDKNLVGLTKSLAEDLFKVLKAERSSMSAINQRMKIPKRVR